MRSLASRDKILSMDVLEPDVYLADRRWILGESSQPVSSLEKEMRLPKNATHFAMAGPYSILVIDRTHVIYSTKSDTGKKVEEFDLPKPIDIISTAPYDGWFLLSLCSGELYMVNNFGKCMPLPPVKYLISTSFCWIDNKKEMILLAGSQFSHVTAFFITSKNITARQLYVCNEKEKAPIASIAQINFCDNRYLIIGTYINLIILRWYSIDEEPVPLKMIERESKTIYPSFVVANEQYIAWLTKENLYLYTIGQLLDDEPGMLTMSFDKLKSLLYVEPEKFLSQLSVPIAMSKYYLILAATSSDTLSNSQAALIIGLDLKTLHVGFRFPFANERNPIIINLNPTKQLLIITTENYIYKLDLSTEQQFKSIPLISDAKESAIQQKKNTDEIPISELLSTFLEEKHFRDATQLLRTALEGIVPPPSDGNDDDAPLSEECIQEICLQFLIYEINVISICKGGDDTDLRFQKQSNASKSKYDMLASLAHILRLREFSRASAKLSDSTILQRSGSETAVQLLLETAVDQSQKDSKIVKLIRHGLDQEKQNCIVLPLNPKNRDDAGELIRSGKFDINVIRNAIKFIMNPEFKKEPIDEIVKGLSPEVCQKVAHLLADPGLDDDQINSIINALEILVNLAYSDKLLPPVIMRYREYVQRKFNEGPVQNIAPKIFQSLKYMPGQINAKVCFELIKYMCANQSSNAGQVPQSPINGSTSISSITSTGLLPTFTGQHQGTSSFERPYVDIILWELALAKDMDAEQKDEELYKYLVDKSYSILLVNKPETFQHLLLNGMYHSAAQVATEAHMYKQAVQAVSLIPKSNPIRNRFIRHYIRVSPKDMWESLCQKYGITHIDEMEKDESSITKEKLARKLEAMRNQIKDLRHKADNSANFLQDLDEWGEKMNPPSLTCCACHKHINSGQGYAFPCGHSFHLKCLPNVVMDALPPDDQDKLRYIQSLKKLTPQDTKQQEELLLSDCPECGKLAVNLIRVPAVGRTNWSIPSLY